MCLHVILSLGVLVFITIFILSVSYLSGFTALFLDYLPATESSLQERTTTFSVSLTDSQKRITVTKRRET